MSFGVKTNERPGTRAQVRYVRLSAYKAREVLDLIRNQPVDRALEILQFSERDPAIVISKCLVSAIANAEHNDGLPADELYVSACYADEGPTLKRWRPRARGRATRIRKRTCHITVIVSRYSDEQLAEIRRREDAKGSSAGGRSRDAAAARRRRVARSRGEDTATEAKAAEAEVDEASDDAEQAEQEEIAEAVAEAGTDDAVVEEAADELDATDEAAGDDEGDTADDESDGGDAETEEQD